MVGQDTFRKTGQGGHVDRFGRAVELSAFMPNFMADEVGLPNVRDAGGAWLMFEGTPEAHIMINGR